MPKLVFPFDHAVQTKYNSKNEIISQETITSGDVYVGYEDAANYDAADKANYYTLELYYNIPDKSYEYYWNKAGYFNGIERSGISNNYFKTVFDGGDVDYDKNSRETDLVMYKGASQMLPSGPSSESSTVEAIYLTYNEAQIWEMQEANPNQLKFVFTYKQSKKETPSTGFTFYSINTYIYTFANIENSEINFDVLEFKYSVKPTYPVSVYVNNNKDCVFAWDLGLNFYRNPKYYYITGYELNIYKDDGTLIVTKQGNPSEQFIVVTSEELGGNTGDIKYTIHLTTNYSYSESTTPFIYFTLVGETDAPDIISISQNSFPTVVWSCDNQISWQMIVKDSKDVVYESGMKSGTEQSFKIPKFLEDGAYSIEMRALNSFGLYTAWSSQAFILNPVKPAAPTNLIVSATNKLTIDISCIAPLDTGTLYVVKRKNSEEAAEIVGEYENGFKDYKVPLNSSYEYAVRNYVEGYADSDWIDGTVVSKGVVLRDAENPVDFVNVWMNEGHEFDVIPNIERTSTLMNVVGRTYPVSEVGEWISSTRRFTGFVNNADYKKLVEMKEKGRNVIFQNTDEVLSCLMELGDGGKYSDEGRILNFSLTRIDGD